GHRPGRAEAGGHHRQARNGSQPVNPASSERALLLRARRGDDAAARALWDRLAGRMIAYATFVAGAADAEDIAQTVFLRALQAPRRDIRRINDGAGWLLRATRNEALNTRRADQRRRARDNAAAPAAPSPGPAAGHDGDEQLLAALAALPRAQHEAVWLHHCCGLTFDQLACPLGVPRSTAASRYRAGIRRLRKALCEPECPPEKEPSHVSPA